jgi:hypothetical protein
MGGDGGGRGATGAGDGALTLRAAAADGGAEGGASRGRSICRALEVGRWVGVVAGFAFAFGHAGAPAERLHILAPWLVVALAGLTGVESVFVGKAAARLTGYVPSGYRRQSGMNNLALAATALLAFVLDWGPAADVAVTSVLLVLLSPSAGKQLWSTWREGNVRPRSFTRPTATVALVAATLPLVASAAAALGR